MTAMVESPAKLREQLLLDLAKRDKTNARETFRGITEASARAMSVTRVGIWRLVSDCTAMVCEDMFVLAEQRHEQGRVRNARDYPAYFDAVLAGRTMVVDDERSDVRTRDLVDPHGSSTSRMDVPIWHRGSLYGVVSYEHHGSVRHWGRDEADFAGNLADVAALTLEASERQALDDRWATVVRGISETILVFDREGRILQSSTPIQPRFEPVREDLFTLEDRQRALDYRDVNGLLVPHHDWPGPRALRGEHVHEVFSAWHKVQGLVGYYRVFAAPLFDGEQVTGFVGMVKNVTEEIQFERLKAEFLATLGFEMKPPVSTVRFTAQDLLRKEPMEHVWHTGLEAIERASRRMEHLIEDVVEISTLGRAGIVRQPVELRGLLEARIDQAGAAAPRHRLHLYAPTSANVIADRTRIAKVIERLLDNAIRYSPDGGDIDVELAVTDTDVVLSFRDHGIGIPANKQSHIFDMFFRAHARTMHDFGGLGLGLYLSREVARLHGGDLWFESAEGQGSRFQLRLPREVRS